MKKAKKLIVLAMACAMLLGSTLTVYAANCPPHDYVKVCSFDSSSWIYKCSKCGSYIVRP